MTEQLDEKKGEFDEEKYTKAGGHVRVVTEKQIGWESSSEQRRRQKGQAMENPTLIMMQISFKARSTIWI